MKSDVWDFIVTWLVLVIIALIISQVFVSCDKKHVNLKKLQTACVVNIENSNCCITTEGVSICASIID